MPRITPPEKMEIHLTEVEKDICELLDGCKKLLESEKGITTTCRVAGGWVRDKVNSRVSSSMYPTNAIQPFSLSCNSYWARKVTIWILHSVI